MTYWLAWTAKLFVKHSIVLTDVLTKISANFQLNKIPPILSYFCAQQLYEIEPSLHENLRKIGDGALFKVVDVDGAVSKDLIHLFISREKWEKGE